MIYFDDKNIIIRSMVPSDIDKLVICFRNQGWHKSLELFEGYYSQQELKKITVLIAQYKEKIAGYVTLYPTASVGPYKNELPEIVDLNVLIAFQNKGIATQLLDVAENIARTYSTKVSLAVGLHSGYGIAQRMYMKRGYLPDGSGVWYRGKQLAQYAPCVNDDDLVLYLYKTI